MVHATCVPWYRCWYAGEHGTNGSGMAVRTPFPVRLIRTGRMAAQQGVLEVVDEEGEGRDAGRPWFVSKHNSPMVRTRVRVRTYVHVCTYYGTYTV
jgi:hypothetical protein